MGCPSFRDIRAFRGGRIGVPYARFASFGPLKDWGLAPVHRHYIYVHRCTAYHVRSHRCALRSLRELRASEGLGTRTHAPPLYIHSSVHRLYPKTAYISKTRADIEKFHRVKSV